VSPIEFVDDVLKQTEEHVAIHPQDRISPTAVPQPLVLLSSMMMLAFVMDRVPPVQIPTNVLLPRVLQASVILLRLTTVDNKVEIDVRDVP
jgi:hypothetical protein